MLAIRRILFPTDFSDGAKQAFPQAAFLADRHDAELHILNVTGRHAFDYEEVKENFPIPIETLTAWLLPARSGARTGGPDLETLTVVQEQIESAAPAEEIRAYVETKNIDLVVMGTHGRRGTDRLIFGSVTEEVVREAPCPVLTVRADADAAPEGVRRVLVPIDFSETTEAAAHHAGEIARTYDASVHLLHVVEEVDYPPVYGVDPADFPEQEVLDQVGRELGKIAREEVGAPRAVVAASAGYPPTAILEYVEDQDIDLIVMATHGRTGLDRMLIGSVAERVVRQAPVPVFVVKPNRKSLVRTAGAGAAAART